MQPRFHSSRDTGQLICISLHAEIYVETASAICMSNITLKRGNIKRDPHTSSSTYILYCGYIYCNRTYILTKAKLHIFKTSILPHLTYCSLVWHFIRSPDKRKLERLQERGQRAVFKDNCGSYDELLSKAKLPTLCNRRLQDVATLMFKVKHGICPTYISDLFNQQRNQYSLRNSDFVIPRFDTVTYGKHSIKYLGPTLWRRLPRDIRNVTNLNFFKKLIRQKDLSTLVSNECGSDCLLCRSYTSYFTEYY